MRSIAEKLNLSFPGIYSDALYFGDEIDALLDIVAPVDVVALERVDPVELDVFGPDAPVEPVGPAPVGPGAGKDS